MSFDLAGVASVFGDDESAVRWSYELLCKVVMFTFEISLPGFLHIYFDVFSGAIQAYVFCMLTMVYINDKMPSAE